VLVWDERQPAQKQAYEKFLGNAIADTLRGIRDAKGNPEFDVTSVCIDDPDQGLSPATLDNTDVLIWWGHVRHGDLKPERAKDIVERVKSGKLSLLALHSAHWAQPFIQAMNERTIEDALKSLPKAARSRARIQTLPPPPGMSRPDHPPNPAWRRIDNSDGTITLEVRLPSCVFPAVRNDGKPSHVTTAAPKHPIARGIPAKFDIPQTEMYAEEFHVPKPDVVIFEERWDQGEWFRGGAVWNLGAGKVFYFRPGHETYPIFKQPIPLRIVENAARWLGSGIRKRKK
jgi:trehalose utilization protein